MAFNQKFFAPVGGQDTAAPAVYSYITSDTLATVVTASYFSPKAFELSEGDIIMAKCSNSSATLVVGSDGESASVPATANPDTGWASYVDTQYTTSGTAFALAADTDTALPNNSGTVIDSQKPEDIDEFYDGTVIKGRNGDGLGVLIYFKAIPGNVSVEALDVWIDIGGSVGELYRQSFSFPKGAGVEKGVVYALPAAYTLDTWEANGGTVKVRAVGGPIDVYAINYNFNRNSRAR
jgi:hypothetical protein